jgi:hypothetical protein
MGRRRCIHFVRLFETCAATERATLRRVGPRRSAVKHDLTDIGRLRACPPFRHDQIDCPLTSRVGFGCHYRFDKVIDGKFVAVREEIQLLETRDLLFWRILWRSF